MKFNVVRDNNKLESNVSLSDGINELQDMLQETKNDGVEVEITFNGLVKATERINTLGIDAIALAQGVGSILKSVAEGS